MLLPMSVKSKGDIVLSAFWSDILHPSGFSMLQRSKGREVAVVSRGRARRSATGLYSLVAPRLGLDYRGVVIVQTFADGVDECQPISLGADDIERIMQAVRDKALPHTTGFSFGASDGTEVEEDLKIFSDALVWLKEDDKGVWRSITYQASW
jgi:hypothetical protein